MIHPRRLEARARVIMEACGGHPTRSDLGRMEPRTRAAWLAYQAGWHLGHARDDLFFLHYARDRGVDSLAWHYRAYRRRRDAARRCIHVAGDYLREAEAAYAALQAAASKEHQDDHH